MRATVTSITFITNAFLLFGLIMGTACIAPRQARNMKTPDFSMDLLFMLAGSSNLNESVAAFSQDGPADLRFLVITNSCNDYVLFSGIPVSEGLLCGVSNVYGRVETAQYYARDGSVAEWGKPHTYILGDTASVWIDRCEDGMLDVSLSFYHLVKPSWQKRRYGVHNTWEPLMHVRDFGVDFKVLPNSALCVYGGGAVSGDTLVVRVNEVPDRSPIGVGSQESTIALPLTQTNNPIN